MSMEDSVKNILLQWQHCYSNAEKLCILRAVNRHIGEGQLSIRAACQQMQIAPKQYSKYSTWSKNQEQLYAWKNTKAKNCDTGPNLSLQDIEKALLNFIFELREQGIPVQISTVVVKPSTAPDMCDGIWLWWVESKQPGSVSGKWNVQVGTCFVLCRVLQYYSITVKM